MSEEGIVERQNADMIEKLIRACVGCTVVRHSLFRHACCFTTENTQVVTIAARRATVQELGLPTCGHLAGHMEDSRMPAYSSILLCTCGIGSQPAVPVLGLDCVEACCMLKRLRPFIGMCVGLCSSERYEGRDTSHLPVAWLALEHWSELPRAKLQRPLPQEP